MRGEGTIRCASRSGCTNREIEGLEYCLAHMPDELLAEAEAITGVRRASQPRGVSPHRALRVISGEAMVRAGEILGQHGAELMNPQPINDPYNELMICAGEILAWKNVLRGHVAELESFGYMGKAGEQIRADVALYERSLTEYSRVLRDIARLNLDARLVGIRQQTADKVERAIDQALTASGLPLEQRAKARQTVREHLKVVA
jgi:hypothetical protein